MIDPSNSVNGESQSEDLSPDKIRIDADAEILDIDEPKISVMEEFDFK